MLISLARITGSGTNDNPYRPAGVDELESWSMIDLRQPDQPDGWGIVGSDSAPRGARALSDNPAADRLEARRAIENTLGVNVSGKHLGRQILGLMLDGRNDGTRWRPLKPRRHAYEVVLHGQVLDRLPRVEGGATSVSDDFNRADGAVGGGWSTVTNATISSNQVSVPTAQNGGMIHGTALGGADMRVSIQIIGEGFRVGPLAREAGGNQAYWGRSRPQAGEGSAICRLSGSLLAGATVTVLASNSGMDPPHGRHLTLTAEGSTLTYTWPPDGSPSMSTTDTNYPSNTGHGVRIESNLGGATLVDNYQAELFGSGIIVGFLAV